MIRLALSIGCPCGVGPEVSLGGAVARFDRDTRVLLVGDLGALRAAARTLSIDETRLMLCRDPAEAWTLPARTIAVLQPTRPLTASERRPGRPVRASGAAQLAFIDAATDLVARGAADALVTGPVNKDAIARSGAQGARGFRGHTEHIAARLGAREVTMAFHADGRGGRSSLTTALVTTHLPLRRVPRAVTAVEVARATYWTVWLAKRLARRRAAPPRVVVAALNPHAGEAGLLGDEEQQAIEPGIRRARTRLAKARMAATITGPVPAESAFRVAAGGGFDAVVAMYHDQATIPMKLLGFGEAVNVTLGLPIIRTSVDHGTAYDRAGKGTADARGMIEAMKLAVRLVRAQ